MKVPLSYFILAFVCTPAIAGSSDPFALALAAAKPGDTIHVSGHHTGLFTTSVDGTAAAPITIQGDGTAVLSSDSKGGAILKIQNDHYRVLNLAVRGGQKGIYITGAHGYLSHIDVADTQEEGFTFKRSRAQYWLVQDCFSHHTGLEGKYGEGFYIGDATENWLSDAPDTPGYITFYNCRTYDTVNDGWDIKEGAHDVKVVNCTADMTTSAPLPASSLPYDHTGAYARANHIQFINFQVKNLLSGRDLTAIRLFTQKGRDGVLYGGHIDLKNVAAENLPHGTLLYVNSGKMGVTLYDDYKLTNVSTLLAEGSADPKTAPANQFVEETWPGEGGETYGTRRPESGALPFTEQPPSTTAPKVTVTSFHNQR